MQTALGAAVTLGLGLLVATPEARATDTSGGYSQVYGVTASYDADADMLNISGSASLWARLPSCEGYCVGMVGTQSLVLHLDEQGQSTGGVFTLYGSAPAIGIEQPRVLLAATVTGAAVKRFFSSSLWITIDMETVFADPALGAWGSHMSLQAQDAGGMFPASMVGSDEVLKTSWQGVRPTDYWDLHASHASHASAALRTMTAVPEPASPALMAPPLLFWACRKWLARVWRAFRAACSAGGGRAWNTSTASPVGVVTMSATP